MTKMTKTVAAAVVIFLAAGTASIAVSAAASDGLPGIPTSAVAASESASPNSTASPSLSPLSGDATIEDVELNGPPSSGTRISEEDQDMDAGYVDPNEPIVPIAELTGTIDGQTFNGTVVIDATASNVTLQQFIIGFEGSVLLADGTARKVQIAPLEYHELEITGDATATLVSYDLSEFIAHWSSPGITINDVAVESMSTSIKVVLHPSYIHPEFGLTGYSSTSAPLMLTFTR